MSEAAVAPNQQLRVILLNNGLEEDRAVNIAEKFSEFFHQGQEWAEKAKGIQVTSMNQVADMEHAREGRLFLKKKRTSIESLRKNLKELSLKEGRAIDMIAKHLTGLIEPTERYLEEQETFVLREKVRVRRELIEARLEQLRPFDCGASENDLAMWSEQEFNNYLTDCQQSYETEKRAILERAEQQQRQTEFEAREKEELRKANKRLAAELEEQRQHNLVARENLDGFIREAQKRDNQKQAEEEAQRQYNVASDREKLTKLASSLSRASIPQIQSQQAADILHRVECMLTEIETFIQREAAKL